MGTSTKVDPDLTIVAGAPPAEIEVRDRATGLPRLLTLDQAAVHDVEAGLPVRQPAAYRGQWSKPGWFYMSSLDRLVGYESLFESWVLLDLDFSGTCAGILPQPCRIHFLDRSQAPYRHVPDYLALDHRGRREVLDVKGAINAAKPKNHLVFDLTRRVCEEVGWGFRVATEPPPAYFRNVRLLAGVRHWRWASVLDEPALALAERVSYRGGMTWVDAERWLEEDLEPWLVPRAVARALWCRYVEADLLRPLDAGTVVTTPAARRPLSATAAGRHV